MMKVTILVLLFFALPLLPGSSTSVQNSNPSLNQPKLIPLWPDPAPGAKGSQPEDIPGIQLYQPPEDKASGAAIVVCPGGGYARLASHEGHDVAIWLNSIGVTAVVLKYRLGPRYGHPAMRQDVLRAIRYTRSKASEWKIDPNRVGVMGFSAGGHLASTAATHFDAGDPNAKDPIERIKSRPDIAILCYPVITMTEPHVHKGSRKNLLGDNPSQDMINLMSNEKRVNEATPPAFLFHTADDSAVPVENSLMFAATLRKVGVPHEMHIYEHGRHGVGLAQNDPALNTWPKLLENWLHARGFVGPPPTNSETAPPKPRDPTIRELIDELRNTPPEFAAHGMIALSLQPEVDDPWKIEILDEAFVFASKARQAVRMKYLEKYHYETRTGYQSRAFDMKLDRLSLQCAILQHLVELDARKAMERWNQMLKQSLRPLRCDETLLYEIKDYYLFLPEFARKAHSRIQIQNDEHIRFFESQLRLITSPAELIGAVEAITNFKPTAEQFDSLIKTFSRSLERIEPDNRSFQYTAESATAVVTNLAVQCREKNVVFGHLLESYRDSLVAQMKAPRCADNYFIRGNPVIRPKFIESFNQVLGGYKPNLKISDDSIRPIKVENEARFHPYWQTPQARNLYRGLNQLHHGSAANPITDPRPDPATNTRSGSRRPQYPSPSDEIRVAEPMPAMSPLAVRQSLRWQQELSKYLDELAKWKPEHEKDGSDYFHQKCTIYGTLVAITPKSLLFDRVIGEYLAFLTQNRFNRESFIEWYLHVTELLRREQSIEVEARDVLIDAMQTSDDLVIRLLIRLQPYFRVAEKVSEKRA